MNFSDFITNHGKKVNKNAFIYLVQISRIDGKIQKEEHELLYKEGKKFGLTDPEIDKLIHSEKDNHYQAPYSLDEKFEHLFNITEMILADDGVGIPEGFALSRATTLGIGLVVGLMQNQLGGSIEAHTTGGTRIVMRFSYS